MRYFYYNAKNAKIETNSNDSIFYDTGNADYGITVVIGADVESIPDYLFICVDDNPHYVTTVKFGDGSICKTIGESAFESCRYLQSIDLPYSVTTIGVYAFRHCEVITSLKIQNNVTSIGDYAFEDCYELSSVDIGSSVETIGSFAFNECRKLTSVTIGSGVQSIGDGAFAFCRSLKNITVDSGNNYFKAENNVLYNYDKTILVLAPAGTDSSFEISSSVTTIGKYAFNNYTYTSVTIPSTVTAISEYAFYECTSLLSITIGSGVTSIGSGAFSRCFKLLEVYDLSSLNIKAGDTNNGYVGYYAENVYGSSSGSSNLTTDNGYVFYNDNGTYYLMGYTGSDTELTLPTLIVDDKSKNYSIYEYAFINNITITSIEIPSSVTSIGDNAFENCTSLTSVTFNESSSVKSIDSCAFYRCTGLTSIAIPDSVTTIGRNAFYECTSLTTVTIGNASIGSSAFNHCTALTSVTFSGSGSETSIGSSAFNYCIALTSVTFSESSSVTSIGNGAFGYCTLLTSITIPDSVTTIGSNAFYNCKGLTSVTFEVTDGWLVTSSYQYTDGSAVDVSDASQNATRLVSTAGYYNYYWYRSQS